MKTKKIYTASSLRFRRWSRAGYAIFCSLSHAVTIGCVAVSISDKSMQKSVCVSKNSLIIFDKDTDSNGKASELSFLEAALNLLLETSILEKPSVSAAACYKNSIIILLINPVELSLSHFNRFLFYSV